MAASLSCFLVQTIQIHSSHSVSWPTFTDHRHSLAIGFASKTTTTTTKTTAVAMEKAKLTT